VVGSCLDEMRKDENINQDSQCSDKNSKPVPPSTSQKRYGLIQRARVTTCLPLHMSI
jgi:hypothetical protein